MDAMTDDCPYVGLGPFTREDERYFFGREVDFAGYRQ